MANVVIRTEKEFKRFVDKVRASETYKHGYFVYTDCFNEDEVRKARKTDNMIPRITEEVLAEGLTEKEANEVYERNKFAVENSGYDYANIYLGNIYNPTGSDIYPYMRATGKKPERALQLHSIMSDAKKALGYTWF